MTGMKNARKTYLFTLRKCRILLFNIRFLLYVDRPAFGLQIHPADVFSDESQYGDDDAAKEQDEADGGRVTWRVLAHDNGFDDLYDEIQGGTRSDDAAEGASELKRRIRKVYESVDGVLAGKMFYAEDAIKAGLVDEIGNFDTAVAAIHGISTERKDIANAME